MAQELAKHEVKLAELSTRVKFIHRNILASAKSTVELAMDAGKWLVNIKELLPHGQFEKYLEEHEIIGTRTARRYMELHEKWPLIEKELGPDAYVSTIDGCLKIVKPPKPKRPSVAEIPPTEVVDGEASDGDAGDDLGLDPGIREAAKEIRERREERERSGAEDAGGSSDLGAGRPKKATAKSLEAALEKQYGILTELLEDYQNIKPDVLHFDCQQSLDSSYGDFRKWKRK